MTKDGKKIALCLGSGGGRGFCHIGAIKAFNELGLKPDMVLGCSMGALVGACYSAGVPYEKLEETCKKIKQNNVLDFAPSKKKYGLFKGDKALNMVGNLLGDVDTFEDLKLPFYCTATSLNTGKQVVFASGDLKTAVRASMSIPIAFQAVEYNDDQLLDGGVIERIPYRCAKSLNPNYIVAVDALGDLDDNFVPDTFLSVIERSYLIMDFQHAREDNNNADVLITPVQPNRHIYTFADSLESVQAGYDATMALKDKLLPLCNPDYN